MVLTAMAGAGGVRLFGSAVGLPWVLGVRRVGLFGWCGRVLDPRLRDRRVVSAPLAAGANLPRSLDRVGPGRTRRARGHNARRILRSVSVSVSVAASLRPGFSVR